MCRCSPPSAPSPARLSGEWLTIGFRRPRPGRAASLCLLRRSDRPAAAEPGEKMDKLRRGASRVEMEPAMKRLVTVALAFLGVLVVAAPTLAQDYPSRTVT